MKNNRKKIVFYLIIATVILLFIIVLIGLKSFENNRVYKDDITVQIPNSEKLLVIKEWTFMLGSGADIYIVDNGNEYMLGSTGGGDDGYCPFENGEYDIINNGNGTVTVKYFFGQSSEETGEPIWKENTFDISYFEK